MIAWELTSSRRTSDMAVSLSKVASGISGLDEILRGGFPEGRTTLISGGPDHVVVDAISAALRMGADKAAFDYLLRLVDVCKKRGITSILRKCQAKRD